MPGKKTLKQTRTDHARGWALAGRADALALLIAAVAAALPFSGSLTGDFVYDDLPQIARNELIQDGRHFWKALSSDVWAFKGETGAAWSNYWRPGFILWLMAGYRLFGVESTVGWHIASLALHVLCVALAYAWLRVLRIALPAALAIALVFAVHPVHVESVAWISASPDLLVTASLLGSLLVLAGSRSRRAPAGRGAPSGPSTAASLLALALFSAALLSKETAVLFPAIVFAALWQACESRGSAALRSAARATVPFAAATALYVALHYLVIGQAQIRTPWRMGALDLLATAPSILVFYLRQAILPLWLGPSYPLRAVRLESAGAFDLWLPLAVLVAALWILFHLARRGPAGAIGLALFLVPLLPALNVNAFTPERLVQDRYLYLPLLGLLMVLVPPLFAWVESLTRPRGRPGRGSGRSAGFAAVLAAISLLLAFQTFRYSAAWTSERRLWEAAAASDPGSATNLAELARLELAEGRLVQARSLLDRALSIQPVTLGFILRADVAMREERFDDAERDLRQVLADQPANAGAYERLAVIYSRQDRLADAESLLRRARERAAHRRCAFTADLAVVLYLQDRKEEALAELESARALVPRELGPGCRAVLFHLAMLHSELGRAAEARAGFEEYLETTTGFTDAATLERRAVGLQALAGLTGAP